MVRQLCRFISRANIVALLNEHIDELLLVVTITDDYYSLRLDVMMILHIWLAPFMPFRFSRLLAVDATYAITTEV